MVVTLKGARLIDFIERARNITPDIHTYSRIFVSLVIYLRQPYDCNFFSLHYNALTFSIFPLFFYFLNNLGSSTSRNKYIFSITQFYLYIASFILIYMINCADLIAIVLHYYTLK